MTETSNNAGVSANSSGALVVSIDLFEGPIDLLLHLVKQRELPIEKISLSAVADQYFECIKLMQQLDLEVAGEYLVIATTLLSIKSSVLLNEPVVLVEDEDGSIIDPHEELLRKLREAAVFKDGARELGRRSMLHVDVFGSVPEVENGSDLASAPLKQHDVMLLAKALKRVFERDGAPQLPMTIAIDSVSVVERMMKVLDTLQKCEGMAAFSALLPEQTRVAAVGTLLALLELCKRQLIAVRQDLEFDEIYIVLAGRDVNVAELASGLSTDSDVPEVAQG